MDRASASHYYRCHVADAVAVGVIRVLYTTDRRCDYTAYVEIISVVLRLVVLVDDVVARRHSSSLLRPTTNDHDHHLLRFPRMMMMMR